MGGQPANGPRNVGRFGVRGPLGIELLGLGLLFAAGGIALFLLIGAQGVTRSESEAVAYQVQGTLSYTPDANAEPVVVETDNRTAQPPPPVIRRLTDRLSLQYRVDVVGGGTAAPEQLSGSQRLSLELRHQSGASEPLSLASTMPLVASSTTLTGTLDLAELEQAIERFQTRTGVAGGPYRLVATAGAEVAGTLEGEPFTASLQQALTFTFDDILLLVEPGQSTPLAEAIGEVERGLEVPREASLPLLGAVRYTHLRIAGFAAAAIGILLLQLVLTSTLLGRRTSETARIRVRHGRMIVVGETGVALPDQLIDIETIDELAAIAEREQRPIVELANGRGTDYLVMESGLAFRFHAGSRART